jgi:hypothetical protein
MQKDEHNIGFWEKRQFFRQKLSKIAENCDHNIDPWSNLFLKQMSTYETVECTRNVPQQEDKIN